MAEAKFVIKSYSKAELVALYGVSATTFNKWIEPIKEALAAPKFCRVLTPRQVSLIVELLGEP